MFHDGNRRLQDQFDSRRIADRLEEKLTRFAFSDGIAPSSRARRSSSSPPRRRGPAGLLVQGGVPGFVRVVGEARASLPFPTMTATACSRAWATFWPTRVGLLFIDMGEKPRRLRVNGTASVSRDDPLMQRFAGAQLLVRVKPRDLSQLSALHSDAGRAEPSKYTPLCAERLLSAAAGKLEGLISRPKALLTRAQTPSKLSKPFQAGSGGA